MQSGISASTELQEAFRAFTSNSSLFALPVTIDSERLTPLDPIPFTSSSFASSLPSLEQLLQPKTPIYLLLRRDDGKLVAVTYIPSTAPVRSKTLFASTRATLVRELGIEKFEAGTIFVTDAYEVLDTKEWEQRDRGATGGNSERDEEILTREERELGAVKRAEDEERFGTKGRDIGYGGGNAEPGGSVEVGGQGRMTMKCASEAKDKLRTGLSESGSLVILGLDIATETIVLHSSYDSVSPNDLAGKIPSSQPSYSFYNYPLTSTVLFAYTCPSGMSVKQRMLYASSRNGVLLISKNEGIDVAKRIEAGSPDEVDEGRLADEMKPSGDSGTSTPTGTGRQGFARPKRPGRR